MDSSRRAVESYWRSRMIDGATSDEDKVTPVYKLDEICELLRSSHAGIVKEVSEFILKRLEHKSPIVKQKALRLIKYAVGKSGTEFRREMQRHSAAVRQLFHYKGQLDPLKGDSLNKAVRDTCHEAISAIFASEDSKPTPAEDLSRRIQGFGNTNFEMPSEEKKSFLSEVVELGSASFKQGLNSITAAHLMMKNDNGSYKSPTLRRSLTTEREVPDRNERGNYQSENWGSSGISKNMVSGPWRQDSVVNNSDTINGDSGSSYAGSKSREERLLETIVTVGGVRLQPSRDAIQLFLVEALKVDAVALSIALELKLQSHLWQVRMKAVCVLESILRKKDDAHFFIVASYFSENKDALLKCSESPQASLSEKAKKVLSLLDGEPTAREKNYSQMPSSVKSETTTAFQMPNLIDTEEPDNSNGIDDFSQKQTTYDLFGDELITEHKTEKEDPFADVSFHATEDKEPGDDLFSGLMIDDKQATKDIPVSENKHAPELYDIFGSNSEILQEQKSDKKDVNDLMVGLFINEKTPDTKDTPWAFSKANFSSPSIRESHQIPNDALNGISNSQIPGMNPNSMPYMVPMHCNPTFTSQTMNYSAMGNFIAQQQLLATMSSFQQFGNLNAQGTTGLGYVSGQSKKDVGYSSALPDIFHPNIPSQPHSSMMNSSKKEENRAFDFISEHLSAARDPKRVV